MEYIKKAVVRGGIPLAVMTAISLAMKCQGLDDFQVKSTFLSGLIVATLAATSVIYDVKGWSLLRQTATHFAVMLVTILPILIVSGWYKLEAVADWAVLFGSFILSGVVFWSIFYVIFRFIIKSSDAQL